MTVMVPRNYNIPCKKELMFTTSEDNQSSVLLCLYEGERSTTRSCNLLDKFQLNDIPPKRRGEQGICVTFYVDANSILHITAKETSTGKDAHIQVNNKARMTQADIDRMVRERHNDKDDDEWHGKFVAAKCALDNYLDYVRKLTSQVSAKQKQALNKVLGDALQWVETNHKCSVDVLVDKRRQLETYVRSLISVTK